MRKDEKKLLIFTYILCMALFTNLAILKDPIDKNAIVVGVVLCFVIGYAHYVIRRFYPDGDKFLLIFASILSVIGIAMIYRLSPETEGIKEGIKQVIWFVLGIIVYILTVVLLPEMSKLSKYKKVYLITTLVLMPIAFIYGKVTNTSTNGSMNWVYIGSFGVQPSEFGKISLVLYLASVLKDYNGEKTASDRIKQLIVPALVVMYSLGFLVLQTDLGSALIFFCVSVAILMYLHQRKNMLQHVLDYFQ